MTKNTTGSIKGNQNTTKLVNELKNITERYPSLTKTLTKKQEQELIKKYKDNREELNRQLIMHNIKSVFNIAKKYMSQTDDFDGLVQDGMLGLTEAANRFDITKNIKFITYAHIWVRKYILANFYAKNIEVDKHSTSLNSPSAMTSKSSNGNSIELEDFVNEYLDPNFSSICSSISALEDTLSSHESVDICSNLLKSMDSDSSLSATDKKVFIDIFYNSEKTRDIAEKYDLSTADVNEIKHRILGKFKNILQSEYNINSYSQIK